MCAREMFASVPVFLLDNTVRRVHFEGGFPLGTDSCSSKGEEISLTMRLTEVSLTYILWT